MNNIPAETVAELIKAGSNLDPRKLIPALMRYDPSKNKPNVFFFFFFFHFSLRKELTRDLLVGILNLE